MTQNKKRKDSMKKKGQYDFGVGDTVVHKDGRTGKVVGHKQEGFVFIKTDNVKPADSVWGGNLTLVKR